MVFYAERAGKTSDKRLILIRQFLLFCHDSIMSTSLVSQKSQNQKIAVKLSNKILTSKNDQISEKDSLLFTQI